MNSKTAATVAEQIDKIMQRTVLGVLLVSGVYAISVVEFFVSESVADILNYLTRALGILIIVLILPGFVKGIRLKNKYGNACKEPEGFIVEMFNKAAGKAFQLTFLFLVLLEMINGESMAHLPSEFFIKLIIMMTLAFFSLTFLFLSRDGSDQDLEDDFSNGEQA